MKPLEKAPQPRPKHLGRAKPDLKLVRPVSASGLTAQVEPFVKIAHELPPLFERHWNELALNRDTIELAPNWDRYMALDISGVLKVMTARAGDVLVGYIFNLVTPHLHYRTTLVADIEMFWLDPSYRGGWFALRWFRQDLDMLEELGVRLENVAVKNHFMAGRVGNIFRRLGFKPIETVWSRTV